MKKRQAEERLVGSRRGRRTFDGEWEEQPEKAASVSRPTSIVYSVRFSREELSELRRAAESRRVLLSELIRTSVIEHIRETDEGRVDIGAALVKLFTRTDPPRAGTLGSPGGHQQFPIASSTSTLVAA